MTVAPTTRIAEVVLCCRGKVLLCLEEVSSSPGSWYWFPPGGKIEDGEVPLQCAIREAKEELGIAAEALGGLSLYRIQSGDWFGRRLFRYSFLVVIDRPPTIKLRVGQREARWVSSSPQDGLVSELTEVLMTRLRSGGYLYD